MKRAITASILSCLAASSVSATTLVIDDFQDGSHVLEAPKTSSLSASGLKSSLSGERYTSVYVDGCTSQYAKCASVYVSGGEYHFEVDEIAYGTWAGFLEYRFVGNIELPPYGSIGLVSSKPLPEGIEDLIVFRMTAWDKDFYGTPIIGVISEDRTRIDFDLLALQGKPVSRLTFSSVGTEPENLRLAFERIEATDKVIAKARLPEPSLARLLASLSVLSGIVLMRMFLNVRRMNRFNRERDKRHDEK